MPFTVLSLELGCETSRASRCDGGDHRTSPAVLPSGSDRDHTPRDTVASSCLAGHRIGSHGASTRHTHGPSGRRRQPCHLLTRPVWSTFFQRGAWEQVSKLNPRARWHLSR